MDNTVVAVDFHNEKENNRSPNNNNEQINSSETSEQPTLNLSGYLINIGTTSCRLFKIVDDNNSEQIKVISYKINDPDHEGYLDGIISHVEDDLFPIMEKDSSKNLRKVFADPIFFDILGKSDRQSFHRDYIMKFYSKTKLFFNILTKEQKVDNIGRLFNESLDDTAIIDISPQGVVLLVSQNNEPHDYSLDITFEQIKEFVKDQNFAEKWDRNTVGKIKSFVEKKIKPIVKDVTAKQAIVLKGEQTFMRDEGYQLKQIRDKLGLKKGDYKQNNYDILFSVDYKETLTNSGRDEADINRLYGFKYGHIIIESIVDLLGSDYVFPKDELSFHGSANAYVFNVVLSGSTKENRDEDMYHAKNVIEKKMRGTVISPIFNTGGKLAKEITPETEYEHLNRIDECDVLFICNKDGHLGDTTKCEIYYAYALKKTIAFWREPQTSERLSFIPHECWGSLPSSEIKS